jgi:MoaA/NifB/PqqE/SkfB family radical SAM enzyme
MNKNDDIILRYRYKTQYYSDADEFKKRVLDKTVIPHQVEVQPGPNRKMLCWLQCPYCYGKSAKDSGERLSIKRYTQILKQVAVGGVNKVIFAGYATDPLNYTHIEDLVQIALDHKQIVGFNTKALKTSDRLLELLATPTMAPKSYFNVSVDAGSNGVYNKVHGLGNKAHGFYNHVLKNVCRVAEARQKSGASFDISISYLINSFNCSIGEVVTFIKDFKNAGCDLLRFSFAQPPRGNFIVEKGFIPTRNEIRKYMAQLQPVIEDFDDERCKIIIVDIDTEYDIYRRPRTLPCFARFIYPTIGFDGWLANCSQSAASNFKKIALGNLAEYNFWKLFYNYDAEQFHQYLNESDEKMTSVNCKCDRKEHIVNAAIKDSGVFNDE